MAQDLIEIEALRQRFLFTKISGSKKKKLRDSIHQAHCYYFRILENLDAPSKELTRYLKALTQVDAWASAQAAPSQTRIQMLQGLITNETKRSSFRKSQNAIFDESMKHIFYIPPNAQDVQKLMKEFLFWLQKNSHIPCALIAGIAHFGINAIHPFDDANGRTARLLTRWILKLYDYDLNGLYCLEKHYASDLNAYYDALGLHGKKTYDEGAQKSDCTDWLAYFLQGMKQSFAESIVGYCQKDK